MRVIQVRTSNGVPTVAYTRGPDLSGTLEGAGGIGGLLARSEWDGSAWSRHAFYHSDGVGNVTALAVPNGNDIALAGSYRYDPFGRLIGTPTGLAAINTQRYSSKDWHNASGFYYFGYRFYDPATQRWPNRDPIEEEGGINLYAYVNNSPIDWIDDLGERAIRPGPGRPGGRNPYRYPNGRPLPYIPPRPPNPNNQWPGGKQPSMCIRIQLVSEQAIEGAEKGEEVAKHLLGDPSKPCPPPPPRPPCPPAAPSIPPYVPNAGSYVNAPPDLGLYNPPPPPRTIYLPRGSGPVIVAPGTIIIWY